VANKAYYVRLPKMLTEWVTGVQSETGVGTSRLFQIAIVFAKRNEKEFRDYLMMLG